jgi:hypothetical protein
VPDAVTTTFPEPGTFRILYTRSVNAAPATTGICLWLVPQNPNSSKKIAGITHARESRDSASSRWPIWPSLVLRITLYVSSAGVALTPLCHYSTLTTIDVAAIKLSIIAYPNIQKENSIQTSLAPFSQCGNVAPSATYSIPICWHIEPEIIITYLTNGSMYENPAGSAGQPMPESVGTIFFLGSCKYFSGGSALSGIAFCARSFERSRMKLRSYMKYCVEESFGSMTASTRAASQAARGCVFLQ